MKRVKIRFDKPIYVDFCILDLSKTLMCDFHYNYIVKKYGRKQKLLFTDTDSLAYEIKTEDFYQDIGNDVEDNFDTSNYAKNHSSGIKTGCKQKVIGKMKDECGGKQISEFVGLRAIFFFFFFFITRKMKLRLQVLNSNVPIIAENRHIVIRFPYERHLQYQLVFTAN